MGSEIKRRRIKHQPPEKHTGPATGLLGCEKLPGKTLPQGSKTTEPERAPSGGIRTQFHQKGGGERRFALGETWFLLPVIICIFAEMKCLKTTSQCTDIIFCFIWNNSKKHSVPCTSLLGLIFNIGTRWSPCFPCA